MVFKVLLFAVPPALDVGGIYRMSPIGTCVLAPRSTLTLVLLVANAYCPIVLIALAAVVIVAKFAREKRPRPPGRLSIAPISSGVASQGNHDHAPPGATGTSGRAMLERQKRISKMLMITFIFSWTCQLPTYVSIIGGISEKLPMFSLYFFLLSLVQYSATPVRFTRTKVVHLFSVQRQRQRPTKPV